MDIIFLNLSLVFLFENGGSSKYCGVYWTKESKKWRAFIQHNGRQHHIGTFEIEEDAAKAVNLKCQELNIALKNPGVGENIFVCKRVLNNEILKKLKAKVRFIFFNWFLFWKEESYGKTICF
jgi:hypothetical protein